MEMNSEYKNLFAAARTAAMELSLADDGRISLLLEDLADAILENADKILNANALDLERMSPDSPL